MRRVIAACLAACLWYAAPARAWDGDVVRVVDGDTVIVDLHNVRVRLYGIDSPEAGQDSGAAATDALRTMLRPGDVVDVAPKGGLSHGRMVGVVTRGGLVLNAEQVRRGHAWIDLKYCRSPLCEAWKKAEKAARKEGLGLWKNAAPVPPWVWRKNGRAP